MNTKSLVRVSSNVRRETIWPEIILPSLYIFPFIYLSAIYLLRIFHIFPLDNFIHPFKSQLCVHFVPCFHPGSPAYPLHTPPPIPVFTPLCFSPAQNNPDVVQRVPVIPLSAAYKGPLPLTGQLSGERSSLMDELLEGEDLVKPLPTRGAERSRSWV